jgi:hypothetical protein
MASRRRLFRDGLVPDSSCQPLRQEMSMRLCLSFFLLVASSVAISADISNICRTWDEGRFCRVNLFALISNAERFDGELVEINGFLIKDEEQFLLFYDESSAGRNNRADAILLVHGSERDIIRSLNRFLEAQVLVRGKVSAGLLESERPAAVKLSVSAPAFITSTYRATRPPEESSAGE